MHAPPSPSSRDPRSLSQWAGRPTAQRAATRSLLGAKGIRGLLDKANASSASSTSPTRRLSPSRATHLGGRHPDAYTARSPPSGLYASSRRDDRFPGSADAVAEAFVLESPQPPASFGSASLPASSNASRSMQTTADRVMTNLHERFDLLSAGAGVSRGVNSNNSRAGSAAVMERQQQHHLTSPTRTSPSVSLNIEYDSVGPAITYDAAPRLRLPANLHARRGRPADTATKLLAAQQLQQQQTLFQQQQQQQQRQPSTSLSHTATIAASPAYNYADSYRHNNGNKMASAMAMHTSESPLSSPRRQGHQAIGEEGVSLRLARAAAAAEGGGEHKMKYPLHDGDLSVEQLAGGPVFWNASNNNSLEVKINNGGGAVTDDIFYHDGLTATTTSDHPNDITARVAVFAAAFDAAGNAAVESVAVNTIGTPSLAAEQASRDDPDRERDDDGKAREAKHSRNNRDNELPRTVAAADISGSATATARQHSIAQDKVNRDNNSDASARQGAKAKGKSCSSTKRQQPTVAGQQQVRALDASGRTRGARDDTAAVLRDKAVLEKKQMFDTMKRLDLMTERHSAEQEREMLRTRLRQQDEEIASLRQSLQATRAHIKASSPTSKGANDDDGTAGEGEEVAAGKGDDGDEEGEGSGVDAVKGNAGNAHVVATSPEKWAKRETALLDQVESMRERMAMQAMMPTACERCSIRGSGGSVGVGSVDESVSGPGDGGATEPLSLADGTNIRSEMSRGRRGSVVLNFHEEKALLVATFATDSSQSADAAVHLAEARRALEERGDAQDRMRREQCEKTVDLIQTLRDGTARACPWIRTGGDGVSRPVLRVAVADLAARAKLLQKRTATELSGLHDRLRIADEDRRRATDTCKQLYRATADIAKSMVARHAKARSVITAEVRQEMEGRDTKVVTDEQAKEQAKQEVSEAIEDAMTLVSDALDARDEATEELETFKLEAEVEQLAAEQSVEAAEETAMQAFQEALAAKAAEKAAVEALDISLAAVAAAKDEAAGTEGTTDDLGILGATDVAAIREAPLGRAIADSLADMFEMFAGREVDVKRERDRRLNRTSSVITDDSIQLSEDNDMLEAQIKQMKAELVQSYAQCRELQEERASTDKTTFVDMTEQAEQAVQRVDAAGSGDTAGSSGGAKKSSDFTSLDAALASDMTEQSHQGVQRVDAGGSSSGAKKDSDFTSLDAALASAGVFTTVLDE